MIGYMLMCSFPVVSWSLTFITTLSKDNRGLLAVISWWLSKLYLVAVFFWMEKSSHVRFDLRAVMNSLLSTTSQLMQTDPRDVTPNRPSHSTIVGRTLGVGRRSTVNNTWSHPLSLSVLSTIDRQLSHISIALGDNGNAVAKILQVQRLGQSPEGVPYFWRFPHFLKVQCSVSQGNPVCQNQLDLCSRFRYNTSLWQIQTWTHS